MNTRPERTVPISIAVVPPSGTPRPKAAWLTDQEAVIFPLPSTDLLAVKFHVPRVG